MQATTPLHIQPVQNEWAVDLREVSKIYSRSLFRRKGIHALRGVDIKVRRGEIFGLLGPNGAGKSTLVKILMSVIRPTRAIGNVLGQSVGHKPTLARVGYLPEHHKFPDYLTGEQVLHFYGSLAGVGSRERKQRCADLLSLVGMSDWRKTKVREYSKGMRQRIGIAQALMNNPDLVVFDEPTDGVDPVGRRDIRVMMSQLKDRGMTVILNSHLLSELEMVCDRVAILVKGKVVSQGTIDDLTSERKHYEIDVVTERNILQDLASLPGLTIANTDNPAGGAGVRVAVERNIIKLKTEDYKVVQPVIDYLRLSGIAIRAIRPIRPTLEDLFMEAVVDPHSGQALTPGAANAPGQGGGR